jgi:phosphocarrier protein
MADRRSNKPGWKRKDPSGNHEQGEWNPLTEPAVEIEVQIRNEEGLHMRPAMLFVDVAGRFGSEIRVSNGQTTVDAKSIMQMTMLAATRGTTLTIFARGSDARQATDALRELVEVKMFLEPPPKPAAEEMKG